MKRLLLSGATAALLAATATTPAQAQGLTAQTLVDSYLADGFTRVEVDTGPSQIKVEAVKDGQKLEVVYDTASGAILRQEQEPATGEYLTPGVEIDTDSRDFVRTGTGNNGIGSPVGAPPATPPATGTIDAQTLVAAYQDSGFTRIEVETGITQIKVEAIRDGQKIEVIYDIATGAILKQETERARGDDLRPGVEISFEDEDFLDDDDDRGRGRGRDDDDDRGRGNDDRDDDRGGNDDDDDDDRGGDDDDDDRGGDDDGDDD